MRENAFKKEVLNNIRENILPGCLILAGDASRIQGIPDTIILYGPRWAALEFKRSSTAPYRPNQEYYIHLMNEMAYASVIHPDNEVQVYGELQLALCS